ncbi:choice-of-anchor Q domain-containing protein [Aquimarina sp. W85]|uniref:choice-of-anchor Q domain-containing protein n=1 Tax=Aquimarina rhodophyticola TaxID=3342246 RepID=UPI00366E21D0
MRILLFAFLLFLLVIWSSCRTDFDASPSNGNLKFSTDTLFLDTLFTNISSSTYALKVFNIEDNPIAIPSITLERGATSNYRLNVDGISGKAFQNIQILPKDSIFIFVETTTDITTQTTANEFLYTDRIIFDSPNKQQDVDLVTLVKDAVFLFPEKDAMTGKKETLVLGDATTNELRIEGFYLKEDQLHFTNEKPYVIYGYAAVPSEKSLVIDPGTRIHFHKNSGIIVANKASLQVNGALSTDPEALENEVIFQGDRLETGFREIPGQWGTIWLTAGSTAHTINYTTIKNATVGILMDFNDGSTAPTLSIKNTQIYNVATVGLLAKNGFIEADNMVINNAGQSALVCSLGGNYAFNHCTFANYWQTGFREFPTVVLRNYEPIATGELLISDLTKATFRNSIIYGSEPIELFLDRIDGASFSYFFDHSLLRFESTIPDTGNSSLYDFTNTNRFNAIILNEDPLFEAPVNNKFFIDERSPANNKGITTPVTTDIIGNARDKNKPDIGAYESRSFK